jgi:DNA-binding MarR family transcriptional regulator
MTKEPVLIGKYLSILYRQAQSYITHHLKPYNIGGGQYIFLLALYRHDGISQEELSQELLIDKATTARALSKLEQAGYVRRSRDPEDKRAYRIFLTDRAREVKPVIYRTVQAWNSLLGADLNEEEKARIGVILQKMVDRTRLYLG